MQHRPRCRRRKDRQPRTQQILRFRPFLARLLAPRLLKTQRPERKASKPEDAVRYAKMAERLSPRDPAQSMWSFARAAAEFGSKNYEESMEWAKVTSEIMPEFPGAWRYLAASLGHLGRLDEARAAVRQLLTISPHDNLRLVSAAFPARRPERLEQYVGGLRIAGLPE